MDLSSASAREDFRWPVSATATIGASAPDLWQIIASPDSLLKGHPFLANNPVSLWNKADSRDEVHYLRGLVYRREFRQWHEGDGYDLEIFHRRHPVSWVSWRVMPVGDRAARLRITVFPYALQEKHALIRWAPHAFVLRPRLRAYLKSVVGGFKWYVENGTPVPRNHFGAHPWFS